MRTTLVIHLPEEGYLARSIAAKLNTLESVIVRGEDSVEDARWSQAKEVVRLLDAGHSQRSVAAEWVNGRTDKPYARQHVIFCERVWRRWGVSELTDRPDWTTAYYTVQQGSDDVIPPEQRKQEWSEAHEVRPPSTVARAGKLAANLLKGDPQVGARLATDLLADPEVRAGVAATPTGASSIIAAAHDVRRREPRDDDAEPLPHVPEFGAVFWAAVRAVDVAGDHLDRYGIGDLLDPEASEAAERLRRRAGEISAAVIESILERSLEG